MSKLRDAIAESIKHRTAEWIASLLLALLVTLALALKTEFAEYISPAISKDWLWRILVVATTLLTLETAYVFTLRRDRKAAHDEAAKLKEELTERLTPRFGVLWSRDLTPHCPGCSVPLSSYAKYMGGWGFQRVKCKNDIYLRNEDGASISLPEAKRSMS